MNWITVNDKNKPPMDGRKVLLVDVNGFIGVGYYNSYDFVLDTYYDIEREICFGRIVAYINF